MKRHEAQAIYRLMERMLTVNATGETYAMIQAEFTRSVIEQSDVETVTEGPALQDNDRWNYRFVPHPEAHLPDSSYQGKGKYWLYKEGAQHWYLARTNYEGHAIRICEAMNKRLDHVRVLRHVQQALLAYRINPLPIPLNTIDSLLAEIREVFDPSPRRPSDTEYGK
jgi:hypothetical protein